MSFDRTRDSAPAFEISTLSPSLARAEPIVVMMRFVLYIVVDDIHVIWHVGELRAVWDIVNTRDGLVSVVFIV